MKASDLLGPADLLALLPYGKSRFYALQKAGAFDHLKTSPVIGPKCYSRIKVARWLAGERVLAPTFGRKAS